MQFTSKITLIFLFILLFSLTTYTQSKSLIGEWTLLSLTENGSNIPLVIGDPVEKKISAQLWLAKDSFTIRPACNNISGKVAIIKPGRLKITQMRTTLMGCSKDAHEIDRSFSAVISKAIRYKIKDRILTLQDATGQNVLTFNYLSSRSRFLK